jgi:DNA-binding transcriptional MerR regulator
VSSDVDEPRQHLSIGEVLTLLQPEFPDVTISKIRFLESQGLLDPERTPSGYRKFYEADLDRLRWILTQQRDHFLPLKVIKDRLAAAPEGELPEGGPGPNTAPSLPLQFAEPAPRHASATGGAGDRAALADALARRAAQRAGDAKPPRHAAPAGPAAGRPDAVPEASLSTAELAAAAGIAERDVERLASFGLIEGRTIGRETVFDGGALAVTRLAASFLERGLEPRHLRMFKVAAEREAGVYEQLVLSLTRQRDPESRTEARRRLHELGDLGQQLRAALLDRAIQELLDR